jgi:hypothetical protein
MIAEFHIPEDTVKWQLWYGSEFLREYLHHAELQKLTNYKYILFRFNDDDDDCHLKFYRDVMDANAKIIAFHSAEKDYYICFDSDITAGLLTLMVS